MSFRFYLRDQINTVTCMEVLSAAVAIPTEDSFRDDFYQNTKLELLPFQNDLSFSAALRSPSKGR